ncbi:hypothetical protein VY88_24190 [Azospirillum thiophilum]|uniref:Uncharacterized protein n=1 Tax=Azospirillum thiophilum TaxID=528244 RepID=A0AAC8ZV36_9PROT|nr:hypothetical protein [Azospirillum thiophilum]ALG73313.1 hypothetical protein AL072_19785 [Azospirillum thiophilum]KJR63233.1 hypothetical protein VY88_24190 [Azospirillum thiophilum]
MAFVELTDTSGDFILVNPLCVACLRAATDGETDLYLTGRGEPLRMKGTPADIARLLEDAAPTPPDPTLSLLA